MWNQERFGTDECATVSNHYLKCHVDTTSTSTLRTSTGAWLLYFSTATMRSDVPYMDDDADTTSPQRGYPRQHPDHFLPGERRRFYDDDSWETVAVFADRFSKRFISVATSADGGRTFPITAIANPSANIRPTATNPCVDDWARANDVASYTATIATKGWTPTAIPSELSDGDVPLYLMFVIQSRETSAPGKLHYVCKSRMDSRRPATSLSSSLASSPPRSPRTRR